MNEGGCMKHCAVNVLKSYERYGDSVGVRKPDGRP